MPLFIVLALLFSGALVADEATECFNDAGEVVECEVTE